MMNKRGAMALTILFAIVYFMAGMIIYQFLKPDIAIQRDVDHMNCSAPDTSGDKVICLLFDGIIPLVVLGILATTAGIITQKVLI